MLKKFSVSNFKNFASKATFDLSNPSNYEFNNEVVNNNTITKGLIYGINGSGKSNLGLAIFDIILHLTDKNRVLPKYENYLNLDSKKNYAEFEYDFEFDGVKLVYKYEKYQAMFLKKEQLFINDEEVVSYDFDTNEGYTSLKGSENMNLVANNPISRIKFLKSNAILEENEVNNAFYKFCDFVDHMLMFYSIEGNGYQGLTIGSVPLTTFIINNNKVDEFQKFLEEANLKYNFVVQNLNGVKELYCTFKKGIVNFMSIASTGTKSLTLLYFWYMIMDQASFIYMDEFDAFYHFELSAQIVQLLKRFKDKQIFLSTHNTDLLNNDLLRPDCFFIIKNNKIYTTVQLTDKDLRKAHNIQKMYKAGSFNG